MNFHNKLVRKLPLLHPGGNSDKEKLYGVCGGAEIRPIVGKIIHVKKTNFTKCHMNVEVRKYYRYSLEKEFSLGCVWSGNASW